MYTSLLSDNILFSGIEKERLPALLQNLQSRTLRLIRGQELIRRGDTVDSVYILLEGSAHAVRTDYDGHDFIYTHLSQNSIFGDMLAGGQNQKSIVTVVMLTQATVLSIPFASLLTPSQNDPDRVRLLQNLISLYAEKYFTLLGRVECLAAHTLREKILRYLSMEAKRQGGDTFQIPFDRAAMASYIGAERSALSRELSRMKKEGLIDYYKNTFKILKSGR